MERTMFDGLFYGPSQDGKDLFVFHAAHEDRSIEIGLSKLQARMVLSSLKLWLDGSDEDNLTK